MASNNSWANSQEPWHILVVSALANGRNLRQNSFVVHKIPSRLYENRSVAEFRKTLSLRFSSLIREEKKSLPKGVDEQGCVMSIHDADTLAKLMSTDSVQEMASDRRLFRVTVLVPLAVFEVLREIHGPIPEFTQEQLEERVSPSRALGATGGGRKRPASEMFGDGMAHNGGAAAAAPAPDLPPGMGVQAAGPGQAQPPVAPWQQQAAGAGSGGSGGRGGPAAAGAGGGSQQQSGAQRGRDDRQPMMRQQGAGARGQQAAASQREREREAPPPMQPVAPAAGPVPGAGGAPGVHGGGQGQYGMASAQGPPLPQGYGGPVVPPPDMLHQQMMAEQQMLMDQHMLQQQAAPGLVPNLPPHLQQQQLLSEQAAMQEMYRRQQQQQPQQPGYWQPQWG